MPLRTVTSRSAGSRRSNGSIVTAARTLASVRISENGRELRDHFAAQLDLLQLDYRTSRKIEEVDLIRRRARCDGEWLQGRGVIIATGARKRRLGVPGEERFELRGVSFSATRDHSLYAGKKVSVIGGGDSAVDWVLNLKSRTRKLGLIHRRQGFRAHAHCMKLMHDAVASGEVGTTDCL